MTISKSVGLGYPMVTGSFYLLIFGAAAWVGAAVTYAGHGLDLQPAGSYWADWRS